MSKKAEHCLFKRKVVLVLRGEGELDWPSNLKRPQQLVRLPLPKVAEQKIRC